VADIFYQPNAVGTEYKLRLSTNDSDLRKIMEQAATNEKTDPWIRVHAAIHLVSIGKRKLAAEVAARILETIPPYLAGKEYKD